MIVVYVLFLFYFVLVNIYFVSINIHDFYLEFLWVFFSSLILLLFCWPSYKLLGMVFIRESSCLYSEVIQCVGYQWYWSYNGFNSLLGVGRLFRLFDVDSRLFLIRGSEYLFGFVSIDVIHSWAVPSLLVKYDVFPGRALFYNLGPFVSGLYYGQCSELCGVNHSFIPIVLEVF